ncbi:hypothetical protein G9A89_014828 [Geosiphon pyriformis]|nr:hypothetical protein G9A89_014828 [Geosiphon pyriformis]
MDPVGSFADGSGSGSAGLRSWAVAKKKAHVESVYSWGPSYKKSKKPDVTGMVIDSLVRPLPGHGSEMESKDISISRISNVGNINNIVAEEMSYMNSNTSKTNNMVDDTTPKKMHMRTYVLEQLPKTPFFKNLSNDNTEIVLPKSRFVESNLLPLVKSCVLEKRSFEPVKLFALDIELFVVPRKTNNDKLIAIKKIFYQIDGFGGVLTPSKFSEIIRASFTSEFNMKKTKKLAICEKIFVNNGLRKKILVDLSRSVIESVFSKFGQVISIRIQLIGLWQKALIEFNSSDVAGLVASKWLVFMGKDSVNVALATLLYTLLVDMMAHNFSDLLELYDRKTCFIGHNPSSYVHDRYMIVCFVDETSKLATIGSIPVFKSVNLHWTGLSLARCVYCKQFDHISTECLLGGNSGVYDKWLITLQDWVRLPNIYKKKHTPIVRPVSFNGKTWAQMAGGSFSHVVSSISSGVGLSSNAKLVPLVSKSLGGFCLVSDILKKLSFVKLVPLVFSPHVSHSVVITSVTINVDSDMAIDDTAVSLSSSFSVVANLVINLSTSSSKVLTTKVGRLEFKIVVLKVSVESVLERLDHLCLELGSDFMWKFAMCNFCGINVSAKQEDIICWHRDSGNLVLIITETKLRDKFNGVKVFSSGLDKSFFGARIMIIMNTFLAHYVSRISEVPGQLLSVKLLFKNKLSVSILGLYAGAFLACASYRKCLDLGLVNSLSGSFYIKKSTWANSQDVARTINFLFIFSNLVNTVVVYKVSDVGEFFDTDYQVVFMSVGLGGLLDEQLNSLYKQVNRDWWKFEFKDADKDFDDVFTKKSSRFHRLELLVSKIVKTSHEKSIVIFDSLMRCWSFLDNVKTSVVQGIVNSGTGFDHVCSVLFGARKSYQATKLAKSLRVKEMNIRSAIDKRMESFEINKSHTIRSVLECPFCKVALDHLVVNNNLILEFDLVKAKHGVVDDVSGEWHCQYQPLKYVFDEAFSGVMCLIKFDELVNVVSNLPDNKAAGLSVLNMLLVLLNSCLSNKSVLSPWKEAWVSIIPKPYEWEGVLTNTCSIVLIKTAHKILFKILSDRISLACSTFNVFHENNFSVLKSTSTQSPIFAIELWLVLQDMWKAYNLVRWEYLEKYLVRIKICSKFIHFFGGIYKNCTNKIMTDFGLTGGYHVHDGLDQRKMFFPFLICGYRLNSHFVSKSGHAKSWAGLSFFFAADTFVNDTIWGFSKPSLAKMNSNVRFFTNLVLRKAILDKQLLYLVLAVLHLIVSYRMQFSFVPVGVCNKWDAMIQRSLKLKSGLRLDFPSDTIYHSSFYGLKTFFQVQSEGKVVSLISFANSGGILSCLFSYRSHDLQVQYWHSVHLLSSLIHIHVSASNNFLVGMVHILFNCNLFLGGFLANSFWFYGGVPMSNILGKFQFLKFSSSLQQYSIAFHWKRLDPCGSVPKWFKLSVAFLNVRSSSFIHPSVLTSVGSLNIFESCDFVFVCDCFSQVHTDSLSVYTNKFLSNLDTVGCRASTATFFEDIDVGLSIGMSGLMSSTLAELQTIALILECIPLLSSVKLFSDSQSALNVCRSELDLVCPDFYNQYWVKHCHIFNVICIKGHSGVLGNECADVIAGDASFSGWYLPSYLGKCFMLADGGVVFGNFRHFVCDIYYSVCHVCWEVGSGSKFLAGSLLSEVDWLHLSLENESNYSKSLESEETESEPEEITGNKKEMTTAYIAKIPEFTGENNDTSPQEWLDKVQKAGNFLAGLKDKLIKKVHSHALADLATAIRHAKSYEIATEEANYTKLVNLAIGETSSAAEEKIDQLTKKSNNNNRINPNNQLVPRNSGQQRPNHYHTQPSYLTIPEELDFQQTALSEGKVAAPRSNPFNHTIPPAQIAQNANLLDIFPFEFKANESPFLLSNAVVNEQKAITAMYTEAIVEGKPIRLILDSKSAGSIITYQLMQQFKQNVDRPAQTVIVTADGIKKTPVGEIDDFLFTIDGIIIPVKVLVMDAPQYQALVGNDWLLKANANLNWET